LKGSLLSEYSLLRRSNMLVTRVKPGVTDVCFYKNPVGVQQKDE